MKDPAALLYIDKWIVATTEMKADCRAYYMDLILSQFNKGSLPNDIEELANICRVRVSEFDNFKQVFEHMLKHKFKQNDEGRLENDFAKEIIQKRIRFVEKRSLSGKISYVIKFAIKHFRVNSKQISYIKNHLNIYEIDTKNEHMLEQVLEQILELYINENVDEDLNKDKSKNIKFKKPTIEEIKTYCSDRNNKIDAQYFFDLNESKGWLVGKTKTPMKDWKAAIRTWEKNNKSSIESKEPPVKTYRQL